LTCRRAGQRAAYAKRRSGTHEASGS
jgi:hypothetical protein